MLWLMIIIRYETGYQFSGKTNIQLWKEILNNDGQQFHRYQQNEQSHSTIPSISTKQHKKNNIKQIILWITNELISFFLFTPITNRVSIFLTIAN
jgi:hypothetical protein